jgi:hypothetical protein
MKLKYQLALIFGCILVLISIISSFNREMLGISTDIIGCTGFVLLSISFVRDCK